MDKEAPRRKTEAAAEIERWLAAAPSIEGGWFVPLAAEMWAECQRRKAE